VTIHGIGTEVGTKEESPQMLFQKLLVREAQLEEASRNMRREAAKLRFFQHQLFPPDWVPCSRELREWFANGGDKHEFLSALLRACRSHDDRMFLLANWAYQQGICEPEGILGERFSKYERASFRGAHAGVSITQVAHALIGENWVPYFKRLLRDREQRFDLVALGYDPGAIEAAKGKKAALTATCAWLAPRRRVTPQTLANAYSWFWTRAEARNPKLQN